MFPVPSKKLLLCPPPMSRRIMMLQIRIFFLPTNESSDGILRFLHKCFHVMAMAVQKLYPNAKVMIGLWIVNDFYYDFDMEPLTDRYLKRIKKEMIELSAET